MNVSLIHCGDGIQPPLGIAYIASYVREYGGHTVQIVDFCAGDTLDDLVDPDYVGFTATTPWYPRCVENAKTVKTMFPDAILVLGGVHVTAMPTAIVDTPFDIGVLGEGEETMLEILSEKPLEEILGITYKHNTETHTNQGRPLIEDLDSIPFPARDLLKMEEYYLKPKQVIRGILRRSTQIMSSRGCPYDCVFCASSIMWKRKVRSFSPEYILRELHELVDVYGVEALFFQDDMLTLDATRLGEVCRLMVEEGLSKQLMWSCQLRANLVDEEVIAVIKDAGCVQAEFGFESGCGKTLTFLKGGNVTVEDNRHAIKLCNNAGIRVLGNFLVGSPQETREDIGETLDFIRSNRMDYVHVHAITPFPGTGLWRESKDRLGGYDWSQFLVHTLEDTAMVSQTLSRQEMIDIYRDITCEVMNLNYGHEQFRLRDLLDYSVLKRVVCNPAGSLKRLSHLFSAKFLPK